MAGSSVSKPKTHTTPKTSALQSRLLPTPQCAVTKLADLLRQVHRIQNKLLWEAFAENYARMKRRWQVDAGLPLVNGGALTLWHGTNATEPNKIYATEHGMYSVSA